MPGFGPHDAVTGVAAIDADREGLCYLMAHIFEPLVECRRRNGTCDRSRCARIGAIIRFVDRGFLRQEKMMTETGFAGSDHRRDHAKLVARLTDMQSHNVCADRDRRLVRDTVIRWATDHSARCDLPLAQWMAEHSMGEAAE